jgi:hypothetical protein
MSYKIVALFGEVGSGVEEIKDWILCNIPNTNYIDNTSLNNLQQDKINIGIFYPCAIEILLKHSEYIVYPIYIETIDAAQRMYRALWAHKDDLTWDCVDKIYLNAIRDFSKTNFHYAKIDNSLEGIDENWKKSLIIDLIQNMPKSHLLFGGKE